MEELRQHPVVYSGLDDGHRRCGLLLLTGQAFIHPEAGGHGVFPVLASTAGRRSFGAGKIAPRCCYARSVGVAMRDA
eukprot:COSAG06_NODE_1437_length_9464_cov_98.879445_4_plen_77_part_00